MCCQSKAGGTLSDFKKHAIFGLEETGPDVKLPRGGAKVHDIEDLPVSRFVATPQVHSQCAVKYCGTTDVDLVIKAITGSGSCATDFNQQGTTGTLCERGNVLHSWRIARANNPHVEQTDIQRATATQHFVGSHP